MTIITDTRFRDVAERERAAFDTLVDKVSLLTAVARRRPLTSAELAEQTLANDILTEARRNLNNPARRQVCDPLFVSTRALLNDQSLIDPALRTHINGQLIFATIAGGAPVGDDVVTMVALTLGILMLDGAEAPPVQVVTPPNARARVIEPNRGDRRFRSFTVDFFEAFGEARGYGLLAEKVLAILAVEGDPDGRGGADPTVRAEEFARVMRGLARREVADDEPQLRRRVNEILDQVQNVGSEDRVADLSIDLPDLEAIYDQNIVAENVRAMGPMIVSAMFEELKVFQVVDRIVEQFQQGMLPIGPGNAGRLLYRYWRETPNRISEQERRNFASITLGIPGGEPGAMVNREFNDLWLRFVSAVSSYIRQNEVDQMLRAALPVPISEQTLRKAARDLSSNLSLHGYGMAHYAAREVQDQISKIIDLLQDKEILASYGARDMWQVVDQVATYELGGAKPSPRYRTLATCGTIITAWLANNVNKINRTTHGTPLIDIDKVRNPPIGAKHKATVNPTEYDLVNACELWLADTATSESQVDQLATNPRMTPEGTSKPIPIPALARDMLEGLDVGLGLGRGQSYGGNGARP